MNNSVLVAIIVNITLNQIHLIYLIHIYMLIYVNCISTIDARSCV